MRRRVHATGSLPCGLAPGSLWLILFRGAQGVGGAMLLATSLTAFFGLRAVPAAESGG
jgi:MFS family permease